MEKNRGCGWNSQIMPASRFTVADRETLIKVTLDAGNELFLYVGGTLCIMVTYKCG